MPREYRISATFLFALGLFGLYIGGRFLLLGDAPTAEGSSCKAICGLVLLFTDLFGLAAGRIVGSVLWFAAGVFFCGLGRRVLRRRR